METPTKVQEQLAARPAGEVFDEKTFFPSGAIAFFVLLVLLGLVIWFGIYFLMLERI
jgi:hypothetical protein